jgi:hypothetical protein
VHLFAPMGKTPPILNFFGMMAGTTRLELATSAVTESLDIKRCRRTSFDTLRYRTSLLIVPLLYPDSACPLARLLSPFLTLLAFGILLQHAHHWAKW